MAGPRSQGGRCLAASDIDTARCEAMASVLVTGGSGFFGGVLKRRLLSERFKCVNLDLHPDPDLNPQLVSVQGDVLDAPLVDSLFRLHRFSAVFHCAAMLAQD